MMKSINKTGPIELYILTSIALFAGCNPKSPTQNSPSKQNPLKSGLSSPRPSLYGITPSKGSTAGGTTVTLSGLDFQTGAQVTIGGVVCLNPIVTSYEIKCTTGPASAGSVKAIVTNPDHQTVSVSFTYETPINAPVPPAFGVYPGSEAEALQVHRVIRLSNPNHWLNSVQLRGRDVPIQYDNIPPAQIAIYTIISDDLAQQVGQRIGDSFTLEEILAHVHSDIFFATVGDPTQIVANPTAVNPAYYARPMAAAQQAYVDFLITLIDKKILALKGTTPWYTNPASPDGTIWVNSSTIGYTEGLHQFTLLMDSVQNNDESRFLESMVNLATMFNQENSPARAGFIGAFTVLFVTKNFLSEGARQNYYHFTLRCGHLN